MLPEFYRTCLQSQLSSSQLHTLEILVWLLQQHKQVRIERLSAYLPLPILFASRRRHLQRFLILPQLSVALIWLPLIKGIIRTQVKSEKQIILTLDRTQWRANNLLMVSVIWSKRAWPVYWQFMPKVGSSNLAVAKSDTASMFTAAQKLSGCGSGRPGITSALNWHPGLRRRKYTLPSDRKKPLISSR